MSLLDTVDALVLVLPTLQPLLLLVAGFVALTALAPMARQRTGFMAALSMLFCTTMVLALEWSVPLGAGLLLDARYAVLSTALLFGGPLVSGFTLLAGIAYRGYLGGVYALAGQASLVLGWLAVLAIVRTRLAGPWTWPPLRVRLSDIVLGAAAAGLGGLTARPVVMALVSAPSFSC